MSGNIHAVDQAEIPAHGAQQAAGTAANFKGTPFMRCGSGQAFQLADELADQVLRGGIELGIILIAPPERHVIMRVFACAFVPLGAHAVFYCRIYSRIYPRRHAAIIASCRRASGFCGCCSSFAGLSTRRCCRSGKAGTSMLISPGCSTGTITARFRVRPIAYRGRLTNPCGSRLCHGSFTGLDRRILRIPNGGRCPAGEREERVRRLEASCHRGWLTSLR